MIVSNPSISQNSTQQGGVFIGEKREEGFEQIGCIKNLSLRTSGHTGVAIRGLCRQGRRGAMHRKKTDSHGRIRSLGMTRQQDGFPVSYVGTGVLDGPFLADTIYL